MKLWPAYTASFTTSLSVKDALARLHAEINAPGVLVRGQTWSGNVGRTADRADFLGDRLADGGKFMRNHNATPGDGMEHNPFQALTHCRIVETPQGSRVDIRMRMSPLPAILLVIWTFLMAGPPIFTTSIEQATATLWIWVFPITLAVITWGVGCYLFSEDAGRTERLLRANLERD